MQVKQLKMKINEAVKIEMKNEVLKEKSVMEMDYFLKIYNRAYSNYKQKLSCNLQNFKIIKKTYRVLKTNFHFQCSFCKYECTI